MSNNGVRETFASESATAWPTNVPAHSSFIPKCFSYACRVRVCQFEAAARARVPSKTPGRPNTQYPCNVFAHDTELVDLAYADDTLVFSCSTPVLHKMFHTLPPHANIYNMKLSMDKTVLLSMNPVAPVDLSDTFRVPKTIKHLGVTFNNKGNVKVTPGTQTGNNRQELQCPCFGFVAVASRCFPSLLAPTVHGVPGFSSVAVASNCFP